MNQFFNSLERFFEIGRLHSSITNEFFAGITSFLSSSYILFLNPLILSSTGMSFEEVFVATCIVSALGCVLMGFMTNLPIVVAPGMALNVYCSYVIVEQYGYTWKVTLILTLLAMIFYFFISMLNFCKTLVLSFPRSLHVSMCAGIGLLFAIMSIKNCFPAYIPEKDWFEYIAYSFSIWKVKLFFICFALIVVFDFMKIKGAIFFGISIATLIAVKLGLCQIGEVSSVPSFSWPEIFQIDVFDALSLKNIKIIFSVLLIMIFDSSGGLVGIFQNIKFQQKKSKKISKAFLATSLTNLFCPVFGSTPTCPYLESLSGIFSGGRTGLTAITVAILFLVSLLFYPVIRAIPDSVISATLMFISILMIKNIKKLFKYDFSELIPGLVAMIAIPISFSIANGIGIGLVGYVLSKVIFKKISHINWNNIMFSIVYMLYLCFSAL